MKDESKGAPTVKPKYRRFIVTLPDRFEPLTEDDFRYQYVRSNQLLTVEGTRRRWLRWGS